ncbi:MAG: D-glycero-beta-D-manno-heptose-7-phosphate kinase [Fidelibacterota bacterium]|nr:MAG: D-glycero-beta-D-manno-heptose-7-phosphate kinase [Candidatus Neomarinimicrobiota bacterium]
MKPDRFQQLHQRFSEQRLLVVGDVMLDTYIWGSVSRISPEAPVPVVTMEQKDHRPGGAANVAYNLHSLGADVFLVGVSGTDIAGRQLENTLSSYEIPHQILQDDTRPTTEKIRVIAGSQHVVRLDKESTVPLSDKLIAKVLAQVVGAIEKYDGLVFQDYHKGTLTRQVIQQLCTLARNRRCPIFVDPKSDHLDSFKGVSLIKPNLNEAEHFAGHPLSTDEEISAAGHDLRERLEAEVVLITRGPKGMDLFDSEGYHRIPTRARQVSDVCGAGDTVVSTYALASVSGASPREAAELANFAAGTVVEEIGVVPVSPEKLEELLLHHAMP